MRKKKLVPTKVEEEETVDVEYTCGSMVWANYLFAFIRLSLAATNNHNIIRCGPSSRASLPGLAWSTTALTLR